MNRAVTSIEHLLGGPRDVEWAIADGRVWVLQARPITAVRTTEKAPDDDLASPDRASLSGTPSSPGVARGRLRIVDSPNDFFRFAAGEVLVCRATSPAWPPVLARAGAVVTAHGGVLSHAAIVARELCIPAVTDVTSAMSLPNGTLVTVDGTAGIVTVMESG